MEPKQTHKKSNCRQCNVKSHGDFWASIAWPVLHFISPVKIQREVYIHHHEHPQDIAEVNKGCVNMDTVRGSNLSVSEWPRIRHPNVKETAPDCLSVSSIANIGRVLLIDMNAVNRHVHLTLFDSWAVRGPILPS